MSFLLVCTTRPRGCCSESKGYNYGRVCFVDGGGPGRTERGPFGKTCVLTCSLALNLNTEQTAAAVKMSRLEPKQSTHVLFLLKVTLVFFLFGKSLDIFIFISSIAGDLLRVDTVHVVTVIRPGYRLCHIYVMGR